jgi:hypothetical protein
VAKETARWLAMTVRAGSTAWMNGVDGRLAGENPFRRQAIAAIDHLTTDCCLRVHGQIVGLEEDFTLAGTPRYADELRDPPFHDWCRTSVALYSAEYDDDLTAQMRDAAKAELDARASAQVQIDRLKEELADLGEYQDVRIRKDDSDQVKRIRNELRMWRARLRPPIWPSHARSRRDYREPFVG